MSLTDAAALLLKAGFVKRQKGVEGDMETRKAEEGGGGIRKVRRQNLTISNFCHGLPLPRIEL